MCKEDEKRKAQHVKQKRKSRRIECGTGGMVYWIRRPTNLDKNNTTLDGGKYVTSSGRVPGRINWDTGEGERELRVEDGE